MAQRKVRRVKRTPTRVERTSHSAGSMPTSRRRVASEEELRESYAYVLNDLRRMFIVAAVMFLLLIALGFLL